MELDSLFSSQRWKILEIISAKPSSPIEISSELNTSVAYVSQQLKLLEAAGIVEKEKTGSVEKGKPRNVYSISEELLHVSLLTRGGSEKRSLKVDSFKKAVLRIWFMPDENLSRAVEKLFRKFDEDLGDIQAIYLDESKGKNSLLVISDSKKVRQRIDSLNKASGGVHITPHSPGTLGKEELSKLYRIYDAHFSSNEADVLKGGKMNNG